MAVRGTAASEIELTLLLLLASEPKRVPFPGSVVYGSKQEYWIDSSKKRKEESLDSPFLWIFYSVVALG